MYGCFHELDLDARTITGVVQGPPNYAIAVLIA